MSIIDVTDDAITALVDDKEVNAAELNVRFVYMNYKGDELNETTEETSVFGLQKTTLANINIAEDETTADGQGTISAAWKKYISLYGQKPAEDEALEFFYSSLPTYNFARKTSALDKAATVVEKARAQKEYDLALGVWEEFVEYYNEFVNCALWGDSIADSAIAEYWENEKSGIEEGGTVTALTYTYYYDVATDTYTVFVTDNGTGSLAYQNSTGAWLTYDHYEASLS
jgi:hypothetical protein